MQKSFLFLLITFVTMGLISCQGVTNQHWSASIPQKTPAVIIPSDDISPQQVLGQEYIPFLDDITSSAVQLISEIDSSANTGLKLNALALYPGVGKKLQPIWLVQAPNQFIKELHQIYYREFTQNKYNFQNRTIYKLHVKDRIIFASQINNLLLLSESSLGIEDAIRSYLNINPSINIDQSELQAPSLVLNTPSLDYWMEQLAKVQYRPGIKNTFKGTGPVVLSVKKDSSEENNVELQFTGNIPLDDENRSEMVDAFSSENAPITLDRYISANASSFGILRLPPRLAPPDSVPDATELDSLLMTNTPAYLDMAKALGSEFALVTYTESGFLSTGEHLYLRRLNDRNNFVNQLNELVEQNVLRRPDDTYVAQGRVLANLIGSELCNYTDFYLNVTGDVVVISKRKGLAEIVESDRNRRRVIYYDQSYMDIRNTMPDEVSGYLFANTDFYDFIKSFLDPETYASAIASKFNQLTATFQLDEENQQVAFDMRTYSRKESDIPYEERWFFPTGGAELSGQPIFSDLRGSSRDEIIFATTSGSVYALASDGTTVMQASTDGEQPLGSPVVYDWYGTGQQVILLAAGSKIYGWNDTGSALPKFPFELDEKITTALTVADVDKNSLPEVVVATADRQLHALDGRGNNINGWPVTTNAPITSKPVIDFFNGSTAVVAFSENTVHAWNSSGSVKGNFPRFINASLNGSPLLYEGNILGGAADGYLYAVGNESLFADSLNVYDNRQGSDELEAVYVSNSALTGTPSVHTLTVEANEQTHEGEMILTMSSNGSIFLISQNGQLRMTKSMGQPAAQDFSPFIIDINSDGIEEVIGLASFGRLYAWQVSNGERLYSLPTSGMKYPVVTDIDEDGNKELVAQTREGLRSWTIYQGQE